MAEVRRRCFQGPLSVTLPLFGRVWSARVRSHDWRWGWLEIVRKGGGGPLVGEGVGKGEVRFRFSDEFVLLRNRGHGRRRRPHRHCWRPVAVCGSGGHSGKGEWPGNARSCVGSALRRALRELLLAAFKQCDAGRQWTLEQDRSRQQGVSLRDRSRRSVLLLSVRDLKAGRCLTRRRSQKGGAVGR